MDENLVAEAGRRVIRGCQEDVGLATGLPTDFWKQILFRVAEEFLLP